MPLGWRVIRAGRASRPGLSFSKGRRAGSKNELSQGRVGGQVYEKVQFVNTPCM
jgi:hypothetical protein